MPSSRWYGLLINGHLKRIGRFDESPHIADFGVKARCAVQYEVRKIMSHETTRVLEEIEHKRGSPCDAVFSSCRNWRYALFRNWRSVAARSNEFVAFIGLNPSTADETENDPTVRRCIDYAKRWGFGGMVMLNAFAFRATDPKDMKKQTDPCGPDNDAAIQAIVAKAGKVVACWGCHGRHLNRDDHLAEILPRFCDVESLKLTHRGSPSHPLYLRADLVPFKWLVRT